jgi:hypothetical protein
VQSDAILKYTLLCSVAFGVGALPWYIIQFPVILTGDSIAQLWQVSGRIPLDTWNPVPITLILKAVNGRADVYIFLQYVLLSATIGVCYARAAAGFGRGMTRSGAVWGVVLALFSGMYPPIGPAVFWLIKDVPFAASFWLAATAWAVVIEQECFGLGRIFLLGVLSGIPSLFRHDGIFLSALFLVAGLYIILRRKRYGYPLLLAGCLVVLVAGWTLPVVFQANTRVTRWAYAIPFVRDLGGVVQAGGRLDDRDQQFLEKIAPLPYLRNHFDPGFPDRYFVGKEAARQVNSQWLADHRAEFAAGYWRIMSRNVRIGLRNRALAFLHFAGLLHQWINIGGVDCTNSFFPEFCPRKIGPGTWFYDFANWNQWNIVARAVLWCSLWPILGLVAIAVFALKRRRPGVLLFSLLPLIFFVCSALIAVASYFRYNYYVLPFFIAGLLAISARPKVGDQFTQK